MNCVSVAEQGDRYNWGRLPRVIQGYRSKLVPRALTLLSRSEYREGDNTGVTWADLESADSILE